MATILAFSKPREADAPVERHDAASELIVFPRTNIRVLRRMWGLPEYGLLVAGPDGRAIGALSDDPAR